MANSAQTKLNHPNLHNYIYLEDFQSFLAMEKSLPYPYKVRMDYENLTQ